MTSRESRDRHREWFEKEMERLRDAGVSPMILWAERQRFNRAHPTRARMAFNLAIVFLVIAAILYAVIYG